MADTFPTNTKPSWKSYIQTQDPADIVASTTVATAIGSKVDATDGQASNITIVGGTLKGVTIDPTSTVSVPVATTASLGVVKVGTGLSVTTDGTLSVSYSYTLPAATAAALGGVKVGAGLSVASDGTLSAPYSYTLPVATTAKLGGVKVGTGLSVADDGTLSASATALTPATTAKLGGVKVGTGLSVTSDGTLSASATELTPATATTLGGVKVGTGIGVATDGTISVATTDNTAAATATTLGAVIIGEGLSVTEGGVVSATGGGSYTLPAATASTLGGVKVGTGLSAAADGTMSVSYSYTLPAATASTLGGVKVGTGLSVTADGTLSATGGGSYILPAATTAALGGVKVGTGLAVTSDGTLSATGGGSYVLPAATATALGGVSVPANVGLSISETGVLSASIATQDEAQDATSNVVLSTPAAVREFTQQYGLGGTYTNAVANCNTATTGGFYNYGKSTNSPVTDSYGILVVVPLGTGYVTQIAIENTSTHTYIRYQSDSTWTDWTRVDIGAIPYASATVAGTVKVGSGLAISPSGVLSSSGGGGGSSAVNAVLAAAYANQQTAVASIFDDIDVDGGGVYKFKAVLMIQPSNVTGTTNGFSVGITGTLGVQTVSLLGSYLGKSGTLSSGAVLGKGSNWTVTESTGSGTYPLVLEGIVTVTSSGGGTINVGIGVVNQYDYIAVVAGSTLTLEKVGTLS